MRRANYERESETVAFSGFLNAERQRILAAATPERRAQMEAAEESRAVYRAWNAVCSGTREGRHVTGLRYLPESNERLRPAVAERPLAPHADLSEAERTEIERQVAPIEDQKLREALENAMRASAEWAKGVQSKKEP